MCNYKNYSVCLVPECTQVIINETKNYVRVYFKGAIHVLVVLIDCEVVDPLSLKVLL